MKKIELYRLKGLYREDFVVEGYRFAAERRIQPVSSGRCGEMKCSSSISVHS